MHKNPGSRLAALVLSLGLGGMLTGCEAEQAAPGPEISEVSGCDPSVATETGGHRRLALVVGVGQYKNPSIPDLLGPPNDARRFYTLLTDENGYGFPKENVCLLLDEEANTARFKQAFEDALMKRARPQDVAVVFYAGHGSQVPDRNDDEPDGWDETFILHDARTDGIRDLVDDEFNAMLAGLREKSQNIALFIDSCNSGTATRAPEASTTMARFFTPDTAPGDTGTTTTGGGGDGAESWAPADLPGVVVFTAATDSKPALERNGRGIFTDALLRVMSQVRDEPLTYAQVARQAPLLVAAESPQVPYFHGDLARPVFGNESRTRPVAWEVKTLGPPLELAGPPLPGLGVGAELRIYGGGVSGADTRDPGKAKATVVITSMTGLNAKAKVSETASDAPAITAGDLAVPVRPADSFTTLKVRTRPSGEPGGVPEEQAGRLRTLVKEDAEASALVELTEGPGDFEISLGGQGQLVLRGPENRIRNTYAAERDVPRSLWQHARQLALRQLQGEGGGDFVDNETLQVSLVEAPAKRQSACAHGTWRQAEPNTEQVIPLCHAWNLRVKLSERSPQPLLIGALVLSTDGSVFALPRDERKIPLQPGEDYTFQGRGETFRGTPPLNVQDRVLVFGTQLSNPVDWSLFTETAKTRGARAAPSALHRALDRYLSAPGTRGIGQAEEGPVEDTTWTLSNVTVRVEANPGFLEPAEPGQAPQRREYTIANFDIRPYLPDDHATALYKVLSVADGLARSSASDGYGYKQHAWDRPTDAENLKWGIDCSRAIWYAFTRADLPYNRDNSYLSTAMMVGRNTPMKDNFESCSNDPDLRLGDILVYRDDGRGDGHVVMVIDPEKRIAWGSHGWDGTPRDLPVASDTGVEYQKIKYKPDWERWDRRTMDLKACWRYRDFEQQRITQRGLPGTAALENICDSNKRCGQM